MKTLLEIVAFDSLRKRAKRKRGAEKVVFFHFYSSGKEKVCLCACACVCDGTYTGADIPIK